MCDYQCGGGGGGGKVEFWECKGAVFMVMSNS